MNIQATLALDIIVRSLVLIAISLFSYKKKYLDLKGVASAFIIGFIVLFLGGWSFFLLLLLFLLVGSILTKIAKEDSFDFAAYFNGSGVRSWRNVAANGFWPTYSVIIYFLFSPCYKIYAIFFFIGSLTSMMSDTVSTEIGLYFGGVPRLIINPWKRVPKGYSGGVTIEGLLGGLIASLIFSLLSIYLFGLVNIEYFVVFMLSGFLGSIIDSILGATIQAKYECPKCKSIVESKIHCGFLTKLISGIEIIDNHLVNFLSSLSGGLLSLILFLLFP